MSQWLPTAHLQKSSVRSEESEVKRISEHAKRCDIRNQHQCSTNEGQRAPTNLQNSPVCLLFIEKVSLPHQTRLGKKNQDHLTP